jgi:sugar phosphate isomerase/epimerase
MRYRYNRREFVKFGVTAALSGGWLINTAASAATSRPLLSFSTLGCPDWTLEMIVDFAAANGYDGIEFRGLQRELDLPKIAGFATELRKRVDVKRLKVVDLGSSAELHHPPGAERDRNLQDARSFIDLAAELACPCVRVFPNRLPKEQDREATLNWIANGLSELGFYAAARNVTVLLETHGDLTATADILKVMRSASPPHMRSGSSPRIGLVWDIVNMWSVTKESPAKVFAALRPYIRHVHIKDLRVVDGKERYVLLGTGETPVFEGIDVLKANGYAGYYSFEWEKLWHPEIDDPALALADYPLKMKRHFD